jgi:RHS repeat-associated protein
MRRGSGWAAGSSGLATGGVAPVWAELDGNNQIQARYLSKDALDAVFARLTAGSSGGVTWNLTDRLGSVRGVMNNSGQLVNSLSYDAFGVSSVTAPGVAVNSEVAAPRVGDRFRYAGYQYDAATGLYYVGARWYDPSQGRWLSRDPLGLAADSNPYRYVSNTPTNAVDPSGKLWSLLLNVGILAWDTFRYATGQIDRQHFLQNVALDFMFITLDVLTLGTGLGSGARGAALAVQGGRLVIRATATVQVCGAVRDAAVVTNTVYHFLEGTSLVGPRGGAMLFNNDTQLPEGSNRYHSRYADGTPIFEGEVPPRISGPNEAAQGRPHTVLRWDHINRRIYQAREYGEGSVPIRDIDFTNPTFPDGRPRPNHPGPPHQHRWVPNDPRNPRAGYRRGAPEPIDER